MRPSAAGFKIRNDGGLAEKKESLGVLINVTILNRKVSEDRMFFAVALDIDSSGILIESDKIMAHTARRLSVLLFFGIK